MTLQVIVLESILWRAPLGLRFLDLARRADVTDGLQVMTWPVGTSGPKQLALRSPLSGVYGFRSLVGLRQFEVGAQPAAAWCGSPPGEATPNFVVTVEDQKERFLPQTLLMCLPKERLLQVPLFSAPARPAPPGLGVVRGEVWEQDRDAPAGWAMVTVSPDSATTYAAVADDRGMFTLFIPYASALPPLVGSPPHGNVAMDQLSWSLTIQVFYKPSQQQRVPGLVGPPDTRSILQQAQAQVMDTPTVQAASATRRIRFGQDLVVTTSGKSRLFIVPT